MNTEQGLISTTEEIPNCPYCEHQNPKWTKGKELERTRRQCEHCKKIALVWYYRVFVVARKEFTDG